MALVNCKECGHEVSTSAKACPHCGAKVKKPIYKRKGFICALIAIVAFLLVPTLLIPNQVNYSENLEVLEAKIVYTTNRQDRVIVGKIRNNNDVDMDLVLLTITGYDKDGNVVDDCAAHSGFLGAGETWEFVTTTIDDDVKSFKVSDLVGKK